MIHEGIRVWDLAPLDQDPRTHQIGSVSYWVYFGPKECT